MGRRILRANTLFTHGQHLAAHERFEDALEAFAQALRLAPRAAGIYLHQGLALAEMERWTDAITSLHQAITLRPKNAVFVMFLGQIFFDQGDYVSARTWCEQALAMQPSNSYAVALQALIDLACHHVTSGYQALMHAVPHPASLLERAALWLVRGHIPSVLAQNNQAIHSRLLLVAETYLLRHATLMQTLSHQVVEAYTAEEPSRLGRFYQWIARSVFVVRYLGVQGRYLGRPAAKAEALLRLQAEYAMARGTLTDAVTIYRQLLARGSDQAALHAQLFELSYAQGAFRDALHHLQQVARHTVVTNGRSAMQALLLGELLYIAGHYTQAQTHLTQAQALQLQDYKLSYYLGLCYLRQGARQAARRAFRQATQLVNPAFDPVIAALRLEEMWRIYQLVAGV